MTDRAVFDCMIYLQAVTNENGPAFACFRLIDEGQVTLCISADILAEARDVLTRPALQAKLPHLTPQRVAAFHQNVQAKSLVVDDVPRIVSHSRDPDDEPYLNLAVAAGATFLVSRDKDLLSLMGDADFRGRFPDLVILDPVAFLQEIRGRRAAEGSGHSPEQTSE
jgi:putative PIN family toxin of toxin-antitoxin system